MARTADPEPDTAVPEVPPAAERARALRDLVLPVLCGGVINRRRSGMAMVARTGWDARGVADAERLHREYGAGPVLLLTRPRRVALILDPDDARRVLAGTPRPFSPAPPEKRAALGQFQPHGVLISDPGDRAVRRRRNEEVLATDRPLHPAAERFVAIAGEEVTALLREAAPDGVLDWPRLDAAWWRTVRRIVLGDAARTDTTLTTQLDKLRGAGNWAVLAPTRRLLRAAFVRRVGAYAARAEDGTLAAHAARRDAVGQIPHWLFAYDAAGIVTARALALLAARPETAGRARREVAAAPPAAGPATWPLLRAAVLESARLWPTTPLILRESVAETRWGDGATLPAGTLLAVYAPYFHRGEPAGAVRDRFAPEVWPADGASPDATATARAFLPFSDGPAGCPGQNLVLLTATAFLAQLLGEGPVELLSPHLDRERLPATLDHFGLSFAPPAGRRA